MEWKVGEAVEIWQGDKIHYISQVSKVYPNGRFKLLYTAYNYRSDGTPIVRSKWHKQFIARKASKATKDQIYRHVTVERCNRILSLTTDQAKEVNRVFDSLGIPEADFYGFDTSRDYCSHCKYKRVKRFEE